MTAKKRRKIILEVFNQSFIKQVTIVYLMIFAVVSLVMMLTDETINTYGDALWYCFVSCATIGFGDLIATSLISRLLTVFMFIITAFLLAGMTAVFVQIFTDIMKSKNNESVNVFMYDLKHLDELSKEELADLSKRVREFMDK